MRRIGDWIQTYTGVVFYPLDPRAEEINIEDIAHSLSLQCRFAGHCREHYSVAQHSIIVAQNLPDELMLWGLLHDASEAYLVDLPRPIKRCCKMGRMYRQYEAALMRCVCERFNLAVEEPDEVKRMDAVLLVTEKRDLMTPEPKPWEDTETPLARRIRPIPSSDAERLFLSVYTSLIKGKGAAA